MVINPQKGLIHIFVLLLLLVGIVVSVYLVQQKTNLFPKAGDLKPTGPETSFSLVGPSDCNSLFCLFNLQKGSTVEEEFKVQVFVRSDIDEANLFRAKMTFPKDLVEVTRIASDSGSFVKNWVEQTYDNNEGTISLVGGVPDPGFKTEQGKESALIVTITFRTKDIGKGTLQFTDDSIIYRNTDNLNILTVKRNLDISISTKPSLTLSPPFQIHLETCLTKEGQNDSRHYPAFWSNDRIIPHRCAGVDQNPPGTGFYQNQTGKNLVLTRIVAALDSTFAAPAALTNAFADICVYAPLTNLPQAKDTTTQSEVLCTNQFITSGQWTKGPQSQWDIVLPGRGLLLQPGGIVACDAQIGTTENLNLQTASKFTCDLYFNDYSWDTSKPAVQSLRTPYVDEFFVGRNVSRYAPHTNTRQYPLRTLGVWVYNGTKGKKTDVCLSKIGSGAGNWCDSVNEDTVGSWNSKATWRSFSEVLAPGDKVVATCNTTDTRELKDCALYFMVEVPENQSPLYPADSITQTDRNSYCNNPDPTNYPYVDANFNATACREVLSRSSGLSEPSPTSTPTPTPILTTKKGDGNKDGKIDLVDMSILLSYFNKTSSLPPIDMNEDKKINSFDFSLLRKILIENRVIRE